MKATAIILAIVIVAGGAFYFLSNNSSSDYANTYTSTDTSTPRETTNPQATTTATSTQKVVSYTLAEVSTHKDAKSCWATINGKVYNLTAWINEHPGGPDKILSICGKDGTAVFTGQHGGQSRPESILASFFIGNLK